MGRGFGGGMGRGFGGGMGRGFGAGMGWGRGRGVGWMAGPPVADDEALEQHARWLEQELQATRDELAQIKQQDSGAGPAETE
jgi:hypothetical protein